MTNQQKERLFELLTEHCTNEQIKDVLRNAKKRDNDQEIRLGGASDEIVAQLRKSHDRGFIKEAQLIALLARAEENGRQHIFYYVPRDNAVPLLADADAIALKVFGGKTPDQMGLPKFYLEPRGSQWAAFRKEVVADSKYTSWTLKLYSGVQRTKFIDERKISDIRFVREYERYWSRDVIIVKYHSFGLLEVRLPTNQAMSLTACREELEGVWTKLLAPAFGLTQFEELNLRRATSEILAQADKQKAEYYIGKGQFADDDGGRADFQPNDPDDSLLESNVRRNAVKCFDECVRLVVTWLNPQQKPELPDKLRVEIGTYFPHEIRIGAQTSPEAVAYVTNRLVQFAR